MPRQKKLCRFLDCIDRTEKDLLPETYLKKYKITLDKLQRQKK